MNKKDSIKQKKNNLITDSYLLASERALAKDWLSKEDEETWKNL